MLEGDSSGMGTWHRIKVGPHHYCVCIFCCISRRCSHWLRSNFKISISIFDWSTAPICFLLPLGVFEFVYVPHSRPLSLRTHLTPLRSGDSTSTVDIHASAYDREINNPRHAPYHQLGSRGQDRRASPAAAAAAEARQ